MDIDRWDDLRFLLAAAREGTLTGAARVLGVDQSTVTRRLQAFQERVGITLFDRLRGGIELTAAGEAFVDAASDVETRVLELERSAGFLSDVKGSVRLTMSELVAVALFDGIADFTQAFPHIELELAMDDTLRSLTRREADVALRITNQPADHLVGRKVGRLALSVYASGAMDLPLATAPWIEWDHSDGSITDVFRGRYDARGPVSLTVNAHTVYLRAAERGLGCVVLPCILGDRLDLVRRTEPWDYADIWVLTHPDLRRSPRIRITMEVMAEVLRRNQDALLGGALPPPHQQQER